MVCYRLDTWSKAAPQSAKAFQANLVRMVYTVLKKYTAIIRSASSVLDGHRFKLPILQLEVSPQAQQLSVLTQWSTLSQIWS